MVLSTAFLPSACVTCMWSRISYFLEILNAAVFCLLLSLLSENVVLYKSKNCEFILPIENNRWNHESKQHACAKIVTFVSITLFAFYSWFVFVFLFQMFGHLTSNRFVANESAIHLISSPFHLIWSNLNETIMMMKIKRYVMHFHTGSTYFNGRRNFVLAILKIRIVFEFREDQLHIA